MWTTIIFRQDKGANNNNDDDKRSHIDKVYQDMQRKRNPKNKKKKNNNNAKTTIAGHHPAPSHGLNFASLIVVEHGSWSIVEALLLFLCNSKNPQSTITTKGFTIWCSSAVDGSRIGIVCTRKIDPDRMRTLDAITKKNSFFLLVKPERCGTVFNLQTPATFVLSNPRSLSMYMGLLSGRANPLGEQDVCRFLGRIPPGIDNQQLPPPAPLPPSPFVGLPHLGDSDRFGEDEFPYDDEDDDQGDDGGGRSQDANFVRNVWANANNPNIIVNNVTNANNVNDHEEDRDYMLAVELSMQQEQPSPSHPRPPPPPVDPRELWPLSLFHPLPSPSPAISIGPRTVGSYAASIRRIVDNRQEQRQLSSAVTTMKTDDRVAHVMKAPAAEDRDIPAMTMLREHNTCTICTTSHITTLVLPCAHFLFCRSCIELWKQKSGTCPSCRNNIDLLVDPKSNVILRDEHNSREKAPQKYMEGLQEELQELTMRLAEKRDPTTAEEPLVIDLTQTNSILVASESQTKRTKVE